MLRQLNLKEENKVESVVNNFSSSLMITLFKRAKKCVKDFFKVVHCSHKNVMYDFHVNDDKVS